MNMVNKNNIKKLANKFHDLHINNETCVMANAWNAGSAILLEDAIFRSNEYRRAGADYLFALGLKDIETIRTLVKEVDGPVNVVMGLSGAPISLAALKGEGVHRLALVTR